MAFDIVSVIVGFLAGWVSAMVAYWRPCPITETLRAFWRRGG